ncbi:MarR family winged helix-turn-helix transcriptional regulator [Secundilactobacillus folii]|uniref:Winged helix DNA-binding protein n=1 Tax=Secundilactobacillus folii TaxID=2678357 RepID=A0A7X2XUX1_9LACO|nr:MarR family transcriptional regulator [Secundilactobacillus folii]MTV81520.1 winged helix DNA-binding protein [Secundilactobacillus folii]
MKRDDIHRYTEEYRKLRDAQFSVFTMYAKEHDLTTKELFVLYILWFSPNGRQQSQIRERLSATKQTISSIIKKLRHEGLAEITESQADHRQKLVRLTPEGSRFTKPIIVPAAEAEIEAMAELSEKDVMELVRITSLFSNNLKKQFHAVNKKR